MEDCPAVLGQALRAGRPLVGGLSFHDISWLCMSPLPQRMPEALVPGARGWRRLWRLGLLPWRSALSLSLKNTNCVVHSMVPRHWLLHSELLQMLTFLFTTFVHELRVTRKGNYSSLRVNLWSCSARSTKFWKRGRRDVTACGGAEASEKCSSVRKGSVFQAKHEQYMCCFSNSVSQALAWKNQFGVFLTYTNAKMPKTPLAKESSTLVVVVMG